jgi:glycosyltransferase involved in cell wall biosynthesis
MESQIVDSNVEKAFSEKIEVIDSHGTLISGGINLIGLAKGELGIGEDLRMASRVMDAAGIDYSIFNFPASSPSRQEDKSISHLIREDLVYNVNMVNLTGFEHARLLTQLDNGIFDKRFTIGAWPWELPFWPRQCEVVFNLVDEIWASSKYTVQAYSNSPTPVIHMPMAVDFDFTPTCSRVDYGLPENVYLFLFVFDGLSYMARKNPIAHINAFWEAFPRQRKDVGLVVKTMNVQNSNNVWREFHEMAATDDRIQVIAETFTKDRVLGLMNSCDAFVSLHRAEGFGRCIAEMMWLGKPVIATNFSGNTDFTTPDTAFLVDGPLVPVGLDEYMFGEGQQWCDPDVGQAAEHMRQCVEDRVFAEKISAAGQKFIRNNYSAEAVSVKYVARLKKLGLV